MKTLLQKLEITTLKYDSQLEEYYIKKKEEAKNSMIIMNNIRCKNISSVFDVVNKETPYSNTYNFASFICFLS